MRFSPARQWLICIRLKWNFSIETLAALLWAASFFLWLLNIITSFGHICGQWSAETRVAKVVSVRQRRPDGHLIRPLSLGWCFEWLQVAIIGQDSVLSVRQVEMNDATLYRIGSWSLLQWHFNSSDWDDSGTNKSQRRIYHRSQCQCWFKINLCISDFSLSLSISVCLCLSLNLSLALILSWLFEIDWSLFFYWVIDINAVWQQFQSSPQPEHNRKQSFQLQ